MNWEVQLFSRGIEGVVSQEWDENPDLHLAEVTNLIDRFYEHIKARHYDLELNDLYGGPHCQDHFLPAIS